jgi:aconitate hydratase
VLTVAQLLRQTGVVGKFVEFYGPGVANVPLANRATLGNISPEDGSTCAIFPVDDETLKYLRLTGRPEKQIALVETYAKQQGLWHDPEHEAVYSQTVELDLATIEPSMAAPTRQQDRIALSAAQHEIESLLANQEGPSPRTGPTGLDQASYESFPASGPVAVSGTTRWTSPCWPARAEMRTTGPRIRCPSRSTKGLRRSSTTGPW